MVDLGTIYSVEADDTRNRTDDKHSGGFSHRRTGSPVFVRPSEFRMKFLNRILHVEATNDKKGLVKFHSNSNGSRTLQTSLVLENGDMGTLLTWEEDEDSFSSSQRKKSTENHRERLHSFGRERLGSFKGSTERINSNGNARSRLSSFGSSDGRNDVSGTRKQSGIAGLNLPDLLSVGPIRQTEAEEKAARPLKLPPIQLPPIYKLRQRQLKPRDFLSPTIIKGPLSGDEWEELHDCRYLRHGLKKFKGSSLCGS